LFSIDVLERSPFRRLLLLLLALTLVGGAAGATSSPWQENPESAVRLVSPWAKAPATGEIVLGVHFRLPPHWHVYWKNSGDAGYPPIVEMVDTPEITSPEILWPAPHRYDIPGDLVALGYETEVVYPVRATIDAPAGSTIPVTVDVDYLVCEVDCIPYRYELTLAQPIAAEGAEARKHPETGPLVDTWVAQVPRDAADLSDVTTRAVLVPDSAGGGGPSLEIEVDGARATDATDLFLEVSDTYRLGRPERMDDDETVRFRVPLEPKQAATAKGPLEGSPFAWVVTALTRGPVGDDTFSLAASRQVEVSAAGLGPPAGDDGVPASSPLALLGRALLAGLALTLAPGVLALALTAGIAAWRSPEPTPTGVAVALGALGMGLVLGLLDATWSGLSVWLLPTRWSAVAAGLALAALLLALWSWRQWGRADAVLAGALPAPVGVGLGALLPLLALGWLPPAVSEPLTGAGTAGAAVAVGAFALFGLALGLPPLVAGLVRGADRAPHTETLPADDTASTPRTTRLAEALGFLAATGVIWQVFVLSRQMGSESVAFIELALLGVALFAWARHRALDRPALAAALAVLAMVAAVAVIWLAARDGATATAFLGSSLEPTVISQSSPDNILQGELPQ
jgi:DsbC/DsbD-like thiol-disulfide interchange protein